MTARLDERLPGCQTPPWEDALPPIGVRHPDALLQACNALPYGCQTPAASWGAHKRKGRLCNLHTVRQCLTPVRNDGTACRGLAGVSDTPVGRASSPDWCQTPAASWGAHKRKGRFRNLHTVYQCLTPVRNDGTACRGVAGCQTPPWEDAIAPIGVRHPDALLQACNALPYGCQTPAASWGAHRRKGRLRNLHTVRQCLTPVRNDGTACKGLAGCLTPPEAQN